MSTPFDSVAIATRIGVAAAMIGIDARVLVEHLSEVAQGAIRAALAYTDANQTALGVGIGLPPNDPWLARRMASLTAGISPSRALSRAAMALPGDVMIERAVGPVGKDGDGRRASIAIATTGTLDDDLAAASAIGVSELACAALAQRMRALEGAQARKGRLLRATVFPGDPEGDNATIEIGAQLAGDPPEIIARLRALAPEAGISDVQLRLIERVHPILAANAPFAARVSVTRGVLDPGLVLSYGTQTDDTVRRVVGGLAEDPPQATIRFGELMGALGADRVVVTELALGRGDPLPLWLGVRVAGQ